MIYLDSAATTPMRTEALEAYVQTAGTAYGNTHSLHDAGSEAAQYVTSCRKLWGQMLGVRKEGIYFTGNASEGNQLAIRSLLRGRPAACRKIVTTKLEHASVLVTLHELEKEGYRIDYVPVDRFGVIDLEQFQQAVDNETALVVMQLVNSEVGAVQPVEECVRIAGQWNIPVHSDVVQGFGKMAVNVGELGVASAVCSAHKIGGPKGVGIVSIDPSVHWESVYEGTTHQQGFRAGTVDVPGIVAATIAAKYALAEQPQAFDKARALQQYLIAQLPEGMLLMGDPDTKSPFIQGLVLPHVEGQWMMLACNRQNIAISTGTACKIGSGEAMSAMSAIGLESDVARKFVRVSFHAGTTESEVDSFLDVVKESLNQFSSVT
ncbi:IscS subfamily cysteine desulfurase [Planococcus salinus]|uniref:Aminotransferase class V-fold PLP-dependent enzyme n=1 Tax=Planococcus salinus TaxID=1848460 RepID=A0A3M8PC59_9BACL|nr:IscS subfamily cysteine desulfurase [Planococcus salinus]RNF41297.1 aminotransferase class V-fold PLP-dependent enzyme [Planococcus salinus]